VQSLVEIGPAAVVLKEVKNVKSLQEAEKSINVVIFVNR
jgi:hypothetical protein